EDIANAKEQLIQLAIPASDLRSIRCPRIHAQYLPAGHDHRTTAEGLSPSAVDRDLHVWAACR
ncbi:hypothetical protein, partial [Streptomyces sp. NPDC005231]|uniref:hypothetical protein n=1 Tax=Streptomyces sp. NPDC005231 TaxID=3157026 RepID=UPI0033BD7480